MAQYPQVTSIEASATLYMKMVLQQLQNHRRLEGVSTVTTMNGFRTINVPVAGAYEIGEVGWSASPLNTSEQLFNEVAITLRRYADKKVISDAISDVRQFSTLEQASKETGIALQRRMDQIEIDGFEANEYTKPNRNNFVAAGTASGFTSSGDAELVTAAATATATPTKITVNALIKFVSVMESNGIDLMRSCLVMDNIVYSEILSDIRAISSDFGTTQLLHYPNNGHMSPGVRGVPVMTTTQASTIGNLTKPSNGNYVYLIDKSDFYSAMNGGPRMQIETHPADFNVTVGAQLLGASKVILPKSAGRLLVA